ncbi:hypothetical protein [Leptolyngbya ohadii]|uniref:hypothetical protein n=1 Tax=Leptolyngbya ohadii TaxID=1962290 RepID=UPI00117A838A|nr:hypothetical protein [Leptolyngbya ohadii]
MAYDLSMRYLDRNSFDGSVRGSCSILAYQSSGKLKGSRRNSIGKLYSIGKLQQNVLKSAVTVPTRLLEESLIDYPKQASAQYGDRSGQWRTHCESQYQSQFQRFIAFI